MVFVQRGRHANDDRVHESDFGVVRCGAEARLLRLLNSGGENAHDVGPARIELCYLISRDVEASYLEAFAAEEQRQGQPDIAHPNNSNADFTGFDLLLELRHTVRVCRSHGVDWNRRFRVGSSHSMASSPVGFVSVLRTIQPVEKNTGPNV